MKEIEQQRDRRDQGQDDEAEVCDPGPCEEGIEEIPGGRPMRLGIYRPVHAGQGKHLGTAVGGLACRLLRAMANKHKQRRADDPVTRVYSFPSGKMSDEAKGGVLSPSLVIVRRRLTTLHWSKRLQVALVAAWLRPEMYRSISRAICSCADFRSSPPSRRDR